MFAPDRAELLLAGRWRAIAAAGGRPARIAAGDRRAVEGRVELILVHPEPTAQRSAGASAPRSSAPHPRRCRAPVRRGRRGGRRSLRRRDATRADTRPPRTRGTAGCRAEAPRWSGTPRPPTVRSWPAPSSPSRTSPRAVLMRRSRHSATRSRGTRTCSTSTSTPTTTGRSSRSPGTDERLVEALVGGIACARERIDLRRHDGVHPRVGAADVVPARRRLAGAARGAKGPRSRSRTASGDELGLPVFLYGELAPGARPASSGAAGPRSSSAASTPESSLPTAARCGSIRPPAASSSAPAGRSSRSTSTSRPTTSRSRVHRRRRPRDGRRLSRRPRARPPARQPRASSRCR